MFIYFIFIFYFKVPFGLVGNRPIVYITSIVYKWWQALTTQSISEPCGVADPFNRLEVDASFSPQSGMLTDEAQTTTQESRTLQFIDRNESYTTRIESVMDSTRYTTADADTYLANFFERPVEILSLEWATGGTLDNVFSPWELWFSNPRVANRLSNFRNFKGKLHVKFLINGNQFYWGKAFASYTPLDGNKYVKYENTFLSQVPALQRPHIWLDPSTSQGGQLSLPFFNPADNLDLTQANPGRNFGTIWLHSLVPLEHAQSVQNPIRITVYAWCDGVELSSPTQTNIGALTPQAGTVDEMQTDGPVSRPASIVSKVAGVLSNVPALAPMAMATQMAANSIARVASAFGYSRPRVIDVEKPMKIWQTGNLAATDQKDTVDSLALTTKQEVTIDPRTVGLGSADELSFDHLNNIYSYLANVPWSLTNNTKDVLFSMPITPCLWNKGSHIIPPSRSAYAMTTTAFTATPFQFWRGSMDIRFQIAASGYHKGRLLIVWDPVVGNADPEVNVVYSRIVDIAEERDFEMTVGWGQPFPALDCSSPFELELPTTYAIGSLFNPNVIQHNGVLSVYVLNELVTSGDNTASVSILVHTRSTDMKYWGPESERIKSSTYEPQQIEGKRPERAPSPTADFRPQSGEVATDANFPTIADAENSAAPIKEAGGNEITGNLMFTAGESIESFRTCLKRYGLVRRIIWQSTVPGNSIQSAEVSTTPYIPIRNPDGGGIAENWPMNMYGYVGSNYSQFRGSTRFRYVPRMQDASSGLSLAYPTVSREQGLQTTDIQIDDALLTKPNIEALAFNSDQSWSGMQVTNNVAGNVLAVEVPWYAGGRCTGRVNDNAGSTALGTTLRSFAINKGQDPEELTYVYDQYISIGEDYNLFFFLGVQPLWFA